jgi:hypothetical protein
VEVVDFDFKMPRIFSGIECLIGGESTGHGFVNVPLGDFLAINEQRAIVANARSWNGLAEQPAAYKAAGWSD